MSGTLVSGVNTLASGVGTYTAGVASIAKNSQLISDNMQSLKAGAASLSDGIDNQVKPGIQDIKNGVNSANYAITTSVGATESGQTLPGVKTMLGEHLKPLHQ